jgi:hypothetical protein
MKIFHMLEFINKPCSDWIQMNSIFARFYVGILRGNSCILKSNQHWPCENYKSQNILEKPR